MWTVRRNNFLIQEDDHGYFDWVERELMHREKETIVKLRDQKEFLEEENSFETGTAEEKIKIK